MDETDSWGHLVSRFPAAHPLHVNPLGLTDSRSIRPISVRNVLSRGTTPFGTLSCIFLGELCGPERPLPTLVAPCLWSAVRTGLGVVIPFAKGLPKARPSAAKPQTDRGGSSAGHPQKYWLEVRPPLFFLATTLPRKI